MHGHNCHLGLHLRILCCPSRHLAPAKGPTNRQGSLSLLHITFGNRHPADASMPWDSCILRLQATLTFTQLDEADTDRGAQAEDKTFLMCDNFERESWIELLPPRDTDSDAFYEELHKGLY